MNVHETMFSMRRQRLFAGLPVLLVLVLSATGCSSTPSASPSPSPTRAGEGRAVAAGVLAVPERAGNAFTYNPDLAPVGAQLAVYANSTADTTTIRLKVVGLLPNRTYVADAHVNACGRTSDAAGPRFQNRSDPAATPGRTSTQPAYSSSQNEVWLDFRTDGNGDAEPTTKVPFTFNDRVPASLVISEAETTTPTQGDLAGAHLACLSV
jgi:superoxide dismutase, Cu-Zn family